MGIFGLFGDRGETHKTKRILIIDDEIMLVESLRAILTTQGFEVVSALNGSEGVVFARNKKPDIILLDLMMPELNGYQTCRMIRQDPVTQHIPILVLTALNMSAQNIEQAFESGANGYVAKPYDTRLLVEKIQKLLS